jgi:hypothetical protein
MSEPDTYPYGSISEITELVVSDVVVLTLAVHAKRRHHIASTVAERIVDDAGVDTRVRGLKTVVAVVNAVMAESDVGCLVCPEYIALDGLEPALPDVEGIGHQTVELDKEVAAAIAQEMEA